jgi:hypothetical protein
MGIVEVDTRDRRQVNRFLDLPFRLYRDVPQWVPPLASEARLILDRRRHPFYRHSEAAFHLAERDGEAVGRVCVLENRNYNAFNQRKAAFFFLFECEDDLDTAAALFDAASAWARNRGLAQIEGPRGMGALDGLGMLVKGFEHRAAFGIPYNLPYYPALLEKLGFVACHSWPSGYLSAQTAVPERVHRLADLVRARRGLTVLRFRTRRELARWIPRLGKLYNDSLGSVPDGVPLTPEEIRTMGQQMLLFADPRLIKIVVKGDELVGFLFAYPDIAAAVQRCRGRLWPLGWWYILRELRRSPWIEVNGAGIIDKYKGLGGTALLFSEMHKSVLEGGYEHADLVQTGGENDNIQRELRSFGVDFYKDHYLYRRDL